MMVPVPPMLADMATDMANKGRTFFVDPINSNSSKTASMIGIIIAVAAVFEIHIDKKAAGSIKLKMSIRGDVPTTRIVFKAILLCKLTCSTAIAIISPKN